MSRVGWCAYDFELAEPTHIAAITNLEPPVVRWFCSIDRHVQNNNPLTTDWADYYGEAFAALAAAGTVLVVQLQMKSVLWNANDQGNTTGCAGWRAGHTYGWLASTAPDSPWATLFANLRAAVNASGVTVHYGLWNEPDWRWAWAWDPRPTGGNAYAPIAPWAEGRFGNTPVFPFAAMGWSGGHQKMADMRALYPELSWTSDGIGKWPGPNTGYGPGYDWHGCIGPDTTIDVIDIHPYYPTVAATMEHIGILVDVFTDEGRTSMPIVIGELGDDPNGSTCSLDWFQRTLDVIDQVEDLYPGRLIGVAAHMNGTRDGVTYPPLYEVLADLEAQVPQGGSGMAAGDIKLAYSSATDLLTSGSLDAIRSGGSTLTAGQFSTSAVIDNSSTLYQDIQFYVQIYTNSASATGPVHLYIAATVAGTDEYEDTLTANQSAAAASGWIVNAHHVASLYTNSQSGYYASGVVNIAGKFGGRAPRKMLLVVRNETTQTIPASANHQIEWRGVYSTVAGS